MILPRSPPTRARHEQTHGPARRRPTGSRPGGYWTNDTYTPLERPTELADKEFFTPERGGGLLKSRVDEIIAQAEDDIHYDDAIWQGENYGKKQNLRTSLIVEPRDGKCRR